MNDRVKEILRYFSEGNDKRQVAKHLGYKDYKGVHNYMVRYGYIWDKEAKTYVNSEDKTTIAKVLRMQDTLPTGRVATVIAEFAKGKDSREIAKQLHFQSTKDMADYMRTKGYVWDTEERNYKKAKEETIDIITEAQQRGKEEEEKETEKEISEHGLLNKYGELLKLLDRNKEKLKVILDTDTEQGKIPRYTLSGINVTKSVHMVTNLDQLTRAYSEEKNIPQREIFQVALIEFFRKYGYRGEIDALLNSR